MAGSEGQEYPESTGVIAEVTSHRPGKAHWTTLTVSATADGRWLYEVSGRTGSAEEWTFERWVVCDPNREALREYMRERWSKDAGSLAQSLLDKLPK